eukprot:TRINITY_DN4432_c0_g1_i1.p1 TRINITY_DN4432_c0_g1~~TRINITY_DN4432_c0_g1_i1.p1  ORF type:complete len:1187 (+),score=274.77 TRINITY_DN4432_c0_g1_i1:1072-4632(+)
MVKVLLFENLFDSQQVVGVSEPLEITTFATASLPSLHPNISPSSSASSGSSLNLTSSISNTLSSEDLTTGESQCCFLVATKDGTVEVYKVLEARDIKPQLLYRLRTSIYNSTVNTSISPRSSVKNICALQYLPPPNDAIVTLEYESEKSLIVVCRIYSNWRADKVVNNPLSRESSSAYQHYEPEEPSTSPASSPSSSPSLGRNGSSSSYYSLVEQANGGAPATSGVLTLPTSTSATCIAVCTATSRLVVANESTITLWKIYEHGTKAEQILNVELQNSTSTITKLALYDSYLAYSSLSEVRVINLVVTQTETKKENAITKLFTLEKEFTRTECEAYSAVEDENYFECKFDEHGNLTSNSYSNLKLSIPSWNSGSAPQDFNKNVEVLGPIVDINHGVRVNKEEGYSLISAAMILYRRFDEEVEPLHTLTFLPEFSLISPGLNLGSFSTKNKQGKATLPMVSSIRCFFSTPRTGYLYDVQQPGLISAIPYTSETLACACSPHFLYAITPDGIEMFTLRNMEFGDRLRYPAPCLIGMQPFIGLQKVAISGEYVILLSKFSEDLLKPTKLSEAKLHQNSKSNSVVGWNVYVLHSTPLNTIYDDFLNRAAAYEPARLEYHQLVLEAHLLSRSKLSSLQLLFEDMKYRSTKDSKTSFLSVHLEAKQYYHLFRHSANLLGDYYFSNLDYPRASKFYSISDKKLSEVVKCMMQDSLSHPQANKFLTDYLDRVLYDESVQDYMDETPALANSIIVHYAENFPEKISSVLLDSNLSQYSLDVALRILEGSSSSRSHSRDVFARACLYSKLKKNSMAFRDFLSIKPERLVEYISDFKFLTNGEKFGSSHLKLLRICAPWPILEVLLQSPIRGEKSAEEKSATMTLSTALDILNDLPDIDQTSFDRIPPPISGQFLSMCYLESLILNGNNSDEVVAKLVDLYLQHLNVVDLRTFGISADPTNASPIANKWRDFHQKAFYQRPGWLDDLSPNSQAVLTRSYSSPALSRSNSSPAVKRISKSPFQRQIFDFTDFYLKKLQGLLCSAPVKDSNHLSKLTAQLIMTKCSNEIRLSLLCYPQLGRFSEGWSELVKQFPHSAVDYGKQYCKEPSQWKAALQHLLEIVLKSNEEEKSHLQECYTKMLEYLSGIFDPALFLSLLPNEGNLFFFVPFLERSIKSSQGKKLNASLQQDVFSLSEQQRK